MRIGVQEQGFHILHSFIPKYAKAGKIKKAALYRGKKEKENEQVLGANYN